MPISKICTHLLMTKASLRLAKDQAARILTNNTESLRPLRAAFAVSVTNTGSSRNTGYNTNTPRARTDAAYQKTTLLLKSLTII